MQGRYAKVDLTIGQPILLYSIVKDRQLMVFGIVYSKTRSLAAHLCV